MPEGAPGTAPRAAALRPLRPGPSVLVTRTLPGRCRCWPGPSPRGRTNQALVTLILQREQVRHLIRRSHSTTKRGLPSGLSFDTHPHHQYEGIPVLGRVHAQLQQVSAQSARHARAARSPKTADSNPRRRQRLHLIFALLFVFLK